MAAGPCRGLDYMHARYRSPLTSRFLSTDPVPGSPTSPQSWNRYVYATNNPLGRVDRNGRKDARTDEEKKILEDNRVLVAVGTMVQKSGLRGSHSTSVESGALIVTGKDGKLSTTPVQTGGVRRVAMASVRDGKVAGTDLKVGGIIHTHIGSGFGWENGKAVPIISDESSPTDKRMARTLRVKSFILDATASLFKFDPAADGDSILLDGDDYSSYLSRAESAYTDSLKKERD